MWSSKDIALIILLAAISFVYAMLIGQVAHLATGILGLNYFFIFGHAIFISFGLLMYEGRRWRYLTQSVIVALLFIPTFAAGTPFDILARMPMILSSFLIDLILNTFHSTFKKTNRLLSWAILGSTSANILSPFLTVINMGLFYPPELTASFLNVITLLLPVVVIEAIAGGYIGYKIYIKTKKIQ